MSHATSTMPAGLVLDWTRAEVGDMASCAVCGRPALCRSPRTGRPCHKHCAEQWITSHARDNADLARLVRACTPPGGRRARG